MSVLHLLGEEEIPEDRLEEYFDVLYKVVAVSERSSRAESSATVRSTYIVDWEQLVHLLEDYGVFGEDIVEVARLPDEEARLWVRGPSGSMKVARA